MNGRRLSTAFFPIPRQCNCSHALKDSRAQKSEMCPMLHGANEELQLLSCLLVNAEAHSVPTMLVCIVTQLERKS